MLSPRDPLSGPVLMFAALVVLTGAARLGFAQTVTLSAVADATLYSEDASKANGSGSYIFAGRTNGGSLRRSFIRFDASSIPAGSTITSAQLTLNMSMTQAAARNVSLHRVLASWGEGPSDPPGEEGTGDSAQTGDTTWTWRFYNVTAWVSAGGQFVATASATTSVNNTGSYSWSSATMASDVQGWLTTPASNFGWELIGIETTNQTAKRFDSRTNSTVANRPRLVVNYTLPTGTCCFASGTCQVLTSANCTAQSGTYQGDGTNCTPNTCPQPTGRCCFANGTCQVLTSTNCTAQSGTYQGDNTNCTPNPCPQPTGACCFTNGTCQVLTAAGCTTQGGTYQSNGLACMPNPCPQPTGGCCFGGGACNVLTATLCATQSGAYQGNGTSCTPSPCVQPTGACCSPNGSCQVLTSTNCSAASGVYQGNSTICSPNPCPQPAGACCFASGVCMVLTAAACTSQSGTYQSNGAPCLPNPCPQPTGACCAASGVCTVLTAAACASQSGTYQGNASICSPNPCPQPTGACCAASGACQPLTSADCSVQSGTYQGNDTVCNPNPCAQPTGGCCAANATCQTLTIAACTIQGGTYQGNGTACATTTCPFILTPFVDPLPLPTTAVPTTGTAGGAAHYDMAITESFQRLHRDLPLTRVWGYAGSYPGPTIEAYRDQAVTVTWINNLRDQTLPGFPLRTTHVFPVDTCLHGASITGQVPVTVVHLHGGHVGAESDGDPDTAFPPGQSSTLYTYPNNQRAATIWYHDHALGITRLNVYMGLAGFYLIRDAAENALNLPGGEYEVPLAIQDRSFNPDGSLKYHATFVDHFFGDYITVNGKVWPYMEVKRGKYRFRLLNGSNSRSYTLHFPAPATSTPVQIGSDQGLLAAPVPITSLTLTPGERADVVMDFSAFAPGTVLTLTNSALSPFPAGGAGPDIPNVMQFRVLSSTGAANPIPALLVPVPRTPESAATVERSLRLTKTFDPVCGHDMWLINALMWDDITEHPRLGATEIWRWINRSGVSHPMHLHMVDVQILDRQDFTVDAGGNIVPTPGTLVLPGPSEMGWKDTVNATPNQITRVITRFTDYTGTFPYHCHILEHEDHEMMRQFRVDPCRADFNGVGGVTVADIFAFLTAWFAGSPSADFNGVGGVTVADIFAFLTAWFAGC